MFRLLSSFSAKLKLAAKTNSVNIPGDVLTACRLLATWSLVSVLCSSYMKSFTRLLQKLTYEFKNKEPSLSLKEMRTILSGLANLSGGFPMPLQPEEQLKIGM